MGKTTGISWCDHTFNPWWGCTKVSSGCANCYAEEFANRLSVVPLWGDSARRQFFTDKYWAGPLAWDKAAAKAGKRAKVFCGSMCDVFENRDDVLASRMHLWQLVERTPNLDWLLLTKRPETMACFLPWGCFTIDVGECISWTPGLAPWRNVWLGTSVENQATADERIPHLLACPAAVRFLSVEPMLEPIDLRLDSRRLDWVICGGESGANRRRFMHDWADNLRRQCHDADVPFFFKQGSALYPGQDDLLYGKQYKEFPTDR
jgi:protein gp37